MPPAKRVTDVHQAPTPLTPPVGGPVAGPGAPTELDETPPTPNLGNPLVCAGPPDATIEGASSGEAALRQLVEDTVMIGG